VAARPKTPLILKRHPVGQNPEDYSVLENGVVVGRIFKAQVAPQDRPWMWASGHSAATVKRAAHGYEPTREAAMAAFAKRAGAEAKGSRSLARSSSPPWLRSVASECPICPMSVDLTPHCIR